MAKKIIVLERQGTVNDCNYIFWLDVPTERHKFYANAGATSQYKDADATELDNIRTGKIKEVSGYKTYEASTTIVKVKADLISMYNSQQNQVNDYNPWVKYGSYYDGSSWTVQGVS
jgi:hypothetical protein